MAENEKLKEKFLKQLKGKKRKVSSTLSDNIGEKIYARYLAPKGLPTGEYSAETEAEAEEKSKSAKTHLERMLQKENVKKIKGLKEKEAHALARKSVEDPSSKESKEYKKLQKEAKKRALEKIKDGRK